MTLDLLFLFYCQHARLLKTRLQHMVLHVTVLLAIHFSASLETSRTPVLALYTLISMPAYSKSPSLPV